LEGPPSDKDSGSELDKFPALFSGTLGTAKRAPYDIEMSDPTPVQSPPYRCALPKTTIFKRTVNELLEQGVITVSKSPYASPAFLVPKLGEDFRMVVDFRKVNAKIVFDSYMMPTIDQGFEHLGGGGAVKFSVFGLNSAYRSSEIFSLWLKLSLSSDTPI
jgi:hypothetical protein